MPPLISLLGKRFGRVVVTARAERAGRHAGWRVRCDCGTRFVSRSDSLREGRTKSCGCWKSERVVTANTTHGGAHTALYTTWLGMIQRCENPGSADFRYYGGRGIRVCTRWRKSFAAFRADMGRKPSRNFSLERIDNNRGYSPSNVRWATAREQACNRRAWGSA